MTGRIYTVGHGAWTLDGLVELLRGRGISHLLDVRSSPHSAHQAEFNRSSLEKAADKKGYVYVYMGEQLGGRPPQADCYVNGVVSYGKLSTKDFFKRGIARLIEGQQQGLNVCLLCAEGDPTNCHRTQLVGRALTAAGILVEHFLKDGTLKPQHQVVLEATTPQLGLGLDN